MRPVRRFEVRPTIPEALAALPGLATNLHWAWDREAVRLFERIWPGWTRRRRPSGAHGAHDVVGAPRRPRRGPGHGARPRRRQRAVGGGDHRADVVRRAAPTRRSARSPTSPPSSASPRRCRSTPAASACCPATTSRRAPTSACRWSASACCTPRATSTRSSTPTAGSRSTASTWTPSRSALTDTGVRVWSTSPATSRHPGVARRRRQRSPCTCSTPTSRATAPMASPSPTGSTAATHTTGCARRSSSASAACARCAPSRSIRRCSTATRAMPGSSASSGSVSSSPTGMPFDDRRRGGARPVASSPPTRPVPAGIDRFERALMEKYFSGFAAECGVTFDELFSIGVSPDEDGDEDPKFNMAVMALRLAACRNGVAQLHGAVSRTMFNGLWPDLPAERGPDRCDHQRRARPQLDVEPGRCPADRGRSATTGRRPAPSAGRWCATSTPPRSGTRLVAGRRGLVALRARPARRRRAQPRHADDRLRPPLRHLQAGDAAAVPARAAAGDAQRRRPAQCSSCSPARPTPPTRPARS